MPIIKKYIFYLTKKSLQNTKFLLIYSIYLNLNRTPLVPVFSFGETDLYDQVANPEGSLLRTAQEFVKKLTGIAFCVPLGRGIMQYSVGIVPMRKPVTTVSKY